MAVDVGLVYSKFTGSKWSENELFYCEQVRGRRFVRKQWCIMEN